MKRELIGSLIWAGVMLAVALGATTAHKLGYIDRDMLARPVTTRMTVSRSI